MVDELVTKQFIKDQLTTLGLKKGDHVVMHSSLGSFGHVEGGADTVLDGVLELLGSKGTLLLPTNTFDGSVTVFLRQIKSIDLRIEPSRTGLITETARKRRDFTRSIHPTHPVVACGKFAHELTCDHHLGNSAAGQQSPYGKLAEMERGKVLLVGVGNDRNTMIHTAEEYFTPYIFNGEQFTVEVIATDGTEMNVTVKGYVESLGRNFSVVDPFLFVAGVMKQKLIGNSTVSLIEAKGLMQVLKKLLDKKPYLLVGQK